jgi:hypothetical protein
MLSKKGVLALLAVGLFNPYMEAVAQQQRSNPIVIGVTCFSEGKEIYKGIAENGSLRFKGQFSEFYNTASKRTEVWINAACIAKYNVMGYPVEELSPLDTDITCFSGLKKVYNGRTRKDRFFAYGDHITGAQITFLDEEGKQVLMNGLTCRINAPG